MSQRREGAAKLTYDVGGYTTRSPVPTLPGLVRPLSEVWVGLQTSRGCDVYGRAPRMAGELPNAE